MKNNLSYLLKISIILAIAIFIIERLLFNGGFNQPINELVKVFGIHFMYAFVLSLINGYFFHYLEAKFTWKKHSKKRLIIGCWICYVNNARACFVKICNNSCNFREPN